MENPQQSIFNQNQNDFIVNDNKILISSRVIAHDLGKEHFQVLRDIRAYKSVCFENQDLKAFFNNHIFEHMYKGAQGKESPEFIMDEEGFDFIIGRFTGEKVALYRLKRIQDFKRMKQELDELKNKPFDPKSVTRLDMAKMLLRAEEEVVQLTEKIEKDKPKVEFADKIMLTSATITIQQFGKVIGLGSVTLCKILREHGFLFKRNGVNLPYQSHILAGRFEVIEINLTENRVTFQTRITGKGQRFLFKYLTDKDIIDLRETA